MYVAGPTITCTIHPKFKQGLVLLREARERQKDSPVLHISLIVLSNMKYKQKLGKDPLM